MKKSTFLSISLFAILSASSAYAEPVKIVIGSGAPGGTYVQLVNELKKQCDSPTLVIDHFWVPMTDKDRTDETKKKAVNEDGMIPGGNSFQNFDRLLGNQITAGIIQLDVLKIQGNAENEDAQRLELIYPLAPEQIHVIVPRMVYGEVTPAHVEKYEAEEVTGYIWKEKKTVVKERNVEAVYGDVENPVKSFEDLKGKKVGSWGGSVISSKILMQKGGIDFQLVEFADRSETVKALEEGKVDAIVAVASAPAAWISSLAPAKYSLVSSSDAMKQKLSDVYTSAQLSYNNFGAFGQQASTFKVTSVLMTRNYEDPDIRRGLSELSNCLKANLVKLRDMPGTHPAWQKVKLDAQIPWDRRFVPEVTTVTKPVVPN